MWSFNGPRWPSFLDEQQQGVTGVRSWLGVTPWGRCCQGRNMGVNPKIGETTPNWMVKIMENPIFQWMIWGVYPLFLETPICFY